MVSSAHHQAGRGQNLRDQLKRIDHQLEPFVGSPLPESQNAMLRVPAPGKIRALGFSRQNAMRAEMHILAAIFFMKNFAITGHEYRHRIRQQKHSSGYRAGGAVGAGVADSRVFQIDGIHQMVQSDMGIAAAEPRQQGGQQPGEGDQRISAKCTEQQIEPHHIRLQLAQGAQNSKRAGGIVEGPAAHDRKPVQFAQVGRNLIAEDGEVQKRIAVQLRRDMQPILAEPARARRESGHQTDFHDFESLVRSSASMSFKGQMLAVDGPFAGPQGQISGHF
jgi:hypothetical protein